MEPEDLREGVESALGHGPGGGSRLDLLASIAKIYEEESVLVDGEALPLWRDCACAAPCWAAFPEEWQPGRDLGDPWNGGIVLPWIGQYYEAGGVVVLGINLREASGLYVEYEIARRQLERLRAGHMKAHGSWWAYRSTRSAAAVLRSMAGNPDLDVADPVELAGTLDETSRLQAVKCSSKDGARSARTPEMKSNCPPRYLRRELAVVRPAALISFGQEAWRAVEVIGKIDESVGGEDFSRSTVRVDEVSFEMVWLHHPSSVGYLWQRSFDLLLTNLRRHPITAAG